MTEPVLIETINDWYCPNCGLTQQTKEARPHVRMHICPKMGMLTAPMVPNGTRAKVVAHEREDYAGKDLIRKDANGRAIMSIVTTRDDGEDAVVFAPTATARSS